MHVGDLLRRVQRPVQVEAAVGDEEAGEAAGAGSRPRPTPSVSSRSSVAPTSRIDFTPAQTTTIGVRASVVRSADSSKVAFASRCTPPRPPVAKTPMPAAAATALVAATVVAPSAPVAAATARSRTESLATPSAPARCSIWSSSRPTISSPPIMPMVAGTAPLSRTVCSISRATRRLSGRGRPCETIVLSSATTGRPSRRARATWSPYRMAKSVTIVPRYGAPDTGVVVGPTRREVSDLGLELLPR